MKQALLICLAVFTLAACNNSKQNDQAAQASPSSAGAAPQPAPTQGNVPVVASAPPAPPPHNYAMVQDGTYGYEPALSEDDIRSGKAVKALVMMRYAGLRDGTYILLLLDENNPNVTLRVTCQAPCNFAKSQVMSGDLVLKTETVRVTPNSLIGAMLEDAMSGQLQPYGQSPSMPQFKASTAASTQAPAAQTAQTTPSSAQPASDEAAPGMLQQTSFDCAKARSIPEYMICHDPDLAAADRDLATAFQQAKNAVSDKTAFTERMRKQWNFRERNCRDKQCLMSWYSYQKRVLTKIAQTGDVAAQDQ